MRKREAGCEETKKEKKGWGYIYVSTVKKGGAGGGGRQSALSVHTTGGK